MSPFALSPSPSDPYAWVGAEPFRAKAHQVLAVTELPWPALAVAAGIPLACLDHLLHGRDGRPVRRVPRRIALRLLELDPEDLRAAARLRIPAGDTSRRLAGLLAEGADARSLARCCGLTLAGLREVAGGRSPDCPAGLAWLAVAAEQRWRARPRVVPAA